MRVLVLGSGGREHALCWKLAQSPSLSELLAAPGNPGIATLAECHPVDLTDIASVVALARQLSCALVIVGPEDPLALGVVDALQAAGFAVFGPTHAAARIESSKQYAKEIMRRTGIPTAYSAAFRQLAPAKAFIESCPDVPIVVKADGLFRGKGVVLAANRIEAIEAVEAMLVSGAYGEAGSTVIIEEFLQGDERSYIALCDGERSVLFPAARDHKRALDHDRGLNTGGMGVIAPAVRSCDPDLAAIEQQIIAPILRALREEGAAFRGALFANVMLTERGPCVLEFNARFGDPEAEALLPLVASDLLPSFHAAAVGSLEDHTVAIRSGACVTVMLASGGYPGHYRTGLPIDGVDRAATIPGATVFHAGTAMIDGQLVTDGGRVLCVAGTGSSLAEARATAYAAAGEISWDGVHYRRDIGEGWQ
ncbi:MAG: phosphoribosylamine--glycine ligase [Chloroflexi bacterium]|nr:phosphoribosylamine--glycine ligase [Chloroflexota bacterium]